MISRVMSSRLRLWSAATLALVALGSALPGVEVSPAAAVEAGARVAPPRAGTALDAGPGRAGRYNPSTPRQVRDDDGVAVPKHMAAAVTETVPVTGRHGVPGSGVAAVALLVTTSGAGRAGAVALAAPGQLSSASVLATFERGDRSIQQVLVPLDSSGRLSLVSSADVSVVLHVVGWVGTASTRSDVAVLDRGVVVLDGQGKRSRVTGSRSRVARVGA
ncbi:hypothetical protein [Nocardioides sp.]|uniref:hypothetical protein n=1 Tax=Nocardioides sp. TaxID=35761 RepID=UPI002B26A421|nr:hypothetical protein [Nocardioides sp.]